EVRAYALQKTMRAMDLGAELGAKIFVLWGGREGVETDACRRPDEAVKRLRKRSTIFVNTTSTRNMDTSSRLRPSQMSRGRTSIWQRPATTWASFSRWIVPTWWASIPSLPTSKWQASICSWRSEEHTSELQSRVDLVCRLLLEKKKKKILKKQLKSYTVLENTTQSVGSPSQGDSV